VKVQHENPLCGDELALAVDVANGTVDDVAFDGHGCAISTASASMMTEAVEGLSPEDALELAENVRLMMHGQPPPEDLGDLMALEGVSKFPVRVKCALLPWMALKDALNRGNGHGKGDADD
jgi:nitrogen fixation NifU-like protein